MVMIIDYGVGNIGSILNMLKRIGIEAAITNNYEELNRASKIILPGVGNFDYGINMLKNANFFNIFIEKITIEKVPILGICLGAQMLLEKSEEGTEPGLGLIKGCCKKFDKSRMNEDLTIPNMGWADVEFLKETPLSIEISENPRYYFVHSYHFCCSDKEDELAVAEYGYPFTAAFNRENIFGVQFHPEKSHKFGMELLRNFAKL